MTVEKIYFFIQTCKS